MKTSGSRIRKYNTYRIMPWRNGRGSTLEIAREPANGQDSAWRLSLAAIYGDGELSPYPGYRRALDLVAGNKLHLTFRGHGTSLLDSTRRAARFQGDWVTRCAIPEGRCTDLSLIVRRGTAGRPPSVVRAPRMLHLDSMAQVAIVDRATSFRLQNATVLPVVGLDRPTFDDRSLHVSSASFAARITPLRADLCPPPASAAAARERLPRSARPQRPRDSIA